MGCFKSCQLSCGGRIREAAARSDEPDPPVSRLAQPSRLDVSARALDVDFGWEMLFEDVIEMPHILSIVTSEGGVLFNK